MVPHHAEFTSDIRHIKGEDNVVADTLSRPSQGEAASVAASVKAPPGSLAAPAVAALSGLIILPAGVDYAAVAAHQQSCASTKAALSTSSLLIQPVPMAGSNLLCDVSTGSPRPVILVVDRKSIFLAFHCLAHPGIQATRRLISPRVVWPRMATELPHGAESASSVRGAR
jgi:hypothetical protein